MLNGRAMKKFTFLTAPLLLAALSSSALAQEASPPSEALPQPLPKAEGNDSINVSPLGLLFGNLYVTYEHMWTGGHAVIVDLGGGQSSGESGSEAHGSAGVGYRWHWRGRQNSGFVGLSLHQEIGSGTVTNDDGTFDMSVRSTMLTANVGKRWMLGDSNWNITLRFGLGTGKHTAEAKESTPEAKMAEKEMNDLLALIPIGWEGELSIGYVF